MRTTPHRLVFIDETSVKANMTRLRGRSPVGERLFGTAPFGKWQTQTFIAGLTCNDLIAPWVIKGAMDRTAFDTYIETQLAPALDPGTVVILDNLATHKSPRAAEALKDCGCWLLYLSACLLPGPEPDRNHSGIHSNQWRSCPHILQAQGPSPTDRSPNLRPTHQSPRQHLLNLRTK
jgi:hypothetical protein